MQNAGNDILKARKESNGISTVIIMPGIILMGTAAWIIPMLRVKAVGSILPVFDMVMHCLPKKDATEDDLPGMLNSQCC